MSDNIKVVVKVRPLIPREVEEKLSYQWRVKNNTLYQIDNNGKDYGATFTFDKVYDESTKTSDVFEDIAKPIVESAIAGINGTIFAYGQTSSGKTYTMTGTEDSQGIIPLAVYNLFEKIKSIPDRDFLLRVSYIEIYNEKIYDLLNVEKDSTRTHKIFEGGRVDVSEHVTTTPEEVLDFIKQGDANRQIGSTCMNEQSSRSHSIFQITIESREHAEAEAEAEAGCVNVSQLNLVDLAGSERAAQSGATGSRFREGTYINKSLSVLGLVIKQLSEDLKHANYRDSKLTRILQNSLGGNAKTSIICAITPAVLEETLSTLQFANRAKAIKNKPEVNAVTTNATMIQCLTKQLAKLQYELENKRYVEHDNRILVTKIDSLQRQILNGFNQRSQCDALAKNRRKTWCAPRRTTLSTLNPIAEVQDQQDLMGFSTPAPPYKNKPVSAGSAPFMSLERPNARSNVSSLSRVSEESTGLSVTPSSGLHVAFDKDVIVLDSDDEDKPAEPCSPYHKCFTSSKTPPCILREKAHRAEQMYDDIVAFTDREKLYAPKVVEYIEKVEKHGVVISKLEEKVDTLHKLCAEKDNALELLNCKITKSEEEIKTVTTIKENLEALCTEYSKKITDWEVSYETLQKKAKIRENELLLLLEEQKIKDSKIADNIANRAVEKEFRNFMDITEEISLVNSDTESSIVNDDHAISQAQCLVTELQAQLNDKNNEINNYEKQILRKHQKIQTLQSEIENFQERANQLNNKITNIETENSMLKETLDTSNKTVQNQTISLDNLRKDVKCYSELVVNLQNGLMEKTSNLDKFDHQTLELMHFNKEKLISNNENIENVTQSLRNLIDIQKEEIKELKVKFASDIQCRDDEAEKLNVERCDKEKQIAILKEELNDFKSLSENTNSEVTRLVQENSSLIQIKNDMCKQYADIQLQNFNLNIKIENILSEKDKEIETLRIDHEKLQHIISEITDDRTEIDKKNVKLESEFNGVMNNIKQIIAMLTGNSFNENQQYENIEVLFAAFNDYVNMLKEEMINMKSQKDLALNDLNSLTKNLAEVTEKYEANLSSLRFEIKELEDLNRNNKNEIKSWTEQCNAMRIERAHVQENLTETLRLTTAKNTSLENDLACNKDEIGELRNKEIHLYAKIEDLEKILKQKEEQCESNKTTLDQFQTQLEHANDTFQRKEEMLQQTIVDRDNIISHHIQNAFELETKLQNMCNEMTKHTNYIDISTKNEQLMCHVIDKINILFSLCDIDESLLFDITQSSLNTDTYLQVVHTLDKIANHIKFLNNELQENLPDDTITILQKNYSKATQELAELKLNNVRLIENLTDIDNKYKQSLLDITKLKEDNIDLNNNLLNRIEQIKLMTTQIVSYEFEIESINKKLTAATQSLLDNNSELQSDCNLELGDFCVELKSKLNNSNLIIDSKDMKTERISDIRKSLSKSMLSVISTPKSLSNICCNKIMDCLLSNNFKVSESTTPSCDSLAVRDSGILINDLSDCKCDLKTSNLKPNNPLKTEIETLQTANKDLIIEREATKNEIKLLIELTTELHKKIANYRTNFLTLSATTYAENKLLQSQVKVLQHHLRRFHNVCQRDIPDIKKQLSELLITLQSGPNYFISPTLNNENFNTIPKIVDKVSSISLLNTTLECDLLMTETNITFDIDNTLMIQNQTVIDTSQAQFQGDNECHSGELHCLTNENLKLTASLEALKMENHTLLIKLITMEKQNNDLEKKLSAPMSDASSQTSLNLSELGQDSKNKSFEILRLRNNLCTKNEELKKLQEECDNLSNQVMDNILEVEALGKEIETLTNCNTELTEKCVELENAMLKKKNESEICSKCLLKNDVLVNKDIGTILNKSGDADNSLQCRKIYTLQNELEASREDCQKINEEVATIRSHLERSNLNIHQNMDLDFSLGDPNIIKTINNSNLSISGNDEDKTGHLYITDKMECLKYYAEEMGVEKENIHQSIKIIDVMKMLHNKLVTKHGNEIENLCNNLKVLQESKDQLNEQFEMLSNKYSMVVEEIAKKNDNLNTISNKFLLLKTNINEFKESLDDSSNSMEPTELICRFKDNLLSVIDNEWSLSTTTVFEIVMDNISKKHEKDFSDIMVNYKQLQDHMENLTKEQKILNEDLAQMRNQLTAKEHEYKALQVQKAIILEINNAVTLDIIKKEQELNDTIVAGCQKLVKHNIICKEHVNPTLPHTKHVNEIFETFIDFHNQYTKQESQVQCSLKKDKENLLLEINNTKALIEEKNREFELLKKTSDSVLKSNQNVTTQLNDKEKQLKTTIKMNEEMKNECQSKNKELQATTFRIEVLSKELLALKESLSKKEETIRRLEEKIKVYKTEEQSRLEKEAKITEILQEVHNLQIECEGLKSLNDLIAKERDGYSTELERSAEIIKEHSVELQKMIVNVNNLQASLKEKIEEVERLQIAGTSVLKENDILRQECSIIKKQVDEFKQLYEDKSNECKKLETNMKTHEKTADIQNNMIKKLQKQKEEQNAIVTEREKSLAEKDKHIDNLNQRCAELLKQYEIASQKFKETRSEFGELDHGREILENRLHGLEREVESLHYGRSPLEVTTRRRRQSAYDSNRAIDDHHEYDDKLSTHDSDNVKPVDFCEYNSSNSISPRPGSRLSRSKQEEVTSGDKEEGTSRGSDVGNVSRRHRQSIHDMRRGVSANILKDVPSSADSKPNENQLSGDERSEVVKLREEIAALRERCRELDEECELCAEVLRERDSDLARLAREKKALQVELAEKLKQAKANSNVRKSETSSPVVEVAVNTDEDWANLHAVVVDRMSYDAELEKNRKLASAYSDLRRRHRELQTKATATDAEARELEEVRTELQSCKQELKDMKSRYRKLQAEHASCRHPCDLDSSKEEISNSIEGGTEAETGDTAIAMARHKRRSMHDQNRLREQDSNRNSDDALRSEIQRLNVKLEQHNRLAVPATLAVANGSAIVQNQQISDVMKENQKLKKINVKLMNYYKGKGLQNRKTESNVDKL